MQSDNDTIVQQRGPQSFNRTMFKARKLKYFYRKYFWLLVLTNEEIFLENLNFLEVKWKMGFKVDVDVDVDSTKIFVSLNNDDEI